MKTFEYRLQPTATQRRCLRACLKESLSLYNEMVALLRERRRTTTGKIIGKYELNSMFKGRSRGISVPATTIQCLSDRIDKAVSRFLSEIKAGKQSTFVRFKTERQWRSIHLRQWGKGDDAFLVDGRLEVPKKLGGRIKIKLHRPLEGVPKTCHLVLRADGHWYALIVCEETPVVRDESRPDIGLDMGLKSFVTDSNGGMTKAPCFFRKSQGKLRILQRTMCRRAKGGRRREKAVQAVGRLHLKVARQRRDWLFKTAKPYADKYSNIYVEDLRIANMLKNHHLAKSIFDASWAVFLMILEHKAESAGGRVIRVTAQYTSQRCSGCGAMVPKSLSVRTHVCPECSLVLDRDVNAALNILRLGRSRQASTWAEPRPCVA